MRAYWRLLTRGALSLGVAVRSATSGDPNTADSTNGDTDSGAAPISTRTATA